jgi:hypothetical protein
VAAANSPARRRQDLAPTLPTMDSSHARNVAPATELIQDARDSHRAAGLAVLNPLARGQSQNGLFASIAAAQRHRVASRITPPFRLRCGSAANVERPLSVGSTVVVWAASPRGHRPGALKVSAPEGHIITTRASHRHSLPRNDPGTLRLEDARQVAPTYRRTVGGLPVHLDRFRLVFPLDARASSPQLALPPCEPPTFLNRAGIT